MIRFNLKVRSDKQFQDRMVNDFNNLKKEFTKEFKQEFSNNEHRKTANKSVVILAKKSSAMDHNLSVEEGK